MFITKVYKYELNGVVYVGALEVPEGATTLEELNILNAQNGFDLVRKADGENVGNSIWLKDGDAKKNYTEVEAPQPEPLPEAEPLQEVEPQIDTME